MDFTKWLFMGIYFSFVLIYLGAFAVNEHASTIRNRQVSKIVIWLCMIAFFATSYIYYQTYMKIPL